MAQFIFFSAWVTWFMSKQPKTNTDVEDPTWVSKVEVYSVTTQIYCIIKIAGNHKKRINRKKNFMCSNCSSRIRCKISEYVYNYLLIQTFLLFCAVFIQEAAIEIGVLKTNKEEFLCVTSTNNVVIFQPSLKVNTYRV